MLLRACIGLALLCVASPVRFLPAVRVVGVVTLFGAAVGLFLTNVGHAPYGAIWRLPSFALLVAGFVVVWAAGKALPVD